MYCGCYLSEIFVTDENYMYDGVVAGQCGVYRTKMGLSMLLYVWCYEVEDS